MTDLVPRHFFKHCQFLLGVDGLPHLVDEFFALFLVRNIRFAGLINKGKVALLVFFGIGIPAAYARSGLSMDLTSRKKCNSSYRKNRFTEFQFIPSGIGEKSEKKQLPEFITIR